MPAHIIPLMPAKGHILAFRMAAATGTQGQTLKQQQKMLQCEWWETASDPHSLTHMMHGGLSGRGMQGDAWRTQPGSGMDLKSIAQREICRGAA